jgi:hypothetical protein
MIPWSDGWINDVVFAGKKITLMFFNNELFVCRAVVYQQDNFRFNSSSHLTNHQSLKMTLVIQAFALE